MSQFIVKDISNGNTRECDSRSEAEETKNDLVSLGADPTEIEIVPPGEGENTAPDAAEVLAEETGEPKENFEPEQDVPDMDELEEHDADEYYDELPDNGPSLSENPVEWMPEHFVDDIQGVPTVNRMGYCVIAEQYGVSVTAEPVTLASETDFEYAEFQAIAETEEGQEYSGFGSAHVDRQDGDDKHLLNELAETRALKRAVSWATGMGITAVEEMQGEL